MQTGFLLLISTEVIFNKSYKNNNAQINQIGYMISEKKTGKSSITCR